MIKERLKKYARLILGTTSIEEPKVTDNIQGEGNEINIAESVLLTNCKFDIEGNNNRIEISESASFNNVTFFIRGDNNKIFIAEKVRFKNGGLIWIEDDDCLAQIGKNSSFQNVHVAVTEPKSKIIIGKNCMFAYDIDLRTGDSHSIIDTTTNERINYAENIFIGDHVWVASHVSILKGVSIANNCVIATRAVVTRSFEEENILIAGIPARKIKENIDWRRERIYKSL